MDTRPYPLLDRQAEMVARVADARRRGRATKGLARAWSGQSPDFRGGVRYQNVRRMSNYLKSRPYRAYVDRLLASLGTG
jgi:hypothetical protein